jgi:hypothetical protein
LALTLGAASTGFFLTFFGVTVTGRFCSVAFLFCAQASVGNTEIKSNANPKKAAAKALDAEPLTEGNKEKPVRIGFSCN